MTRVGITGHQRLADAEQWPWVEQQLKAELARWAPPLICFTSLAIGADQLFARAALERGGALVAILPFKDLERTFAPEDLASYRWLLRRSEVETLDTPGGDEAAYFAAGRRVVECADVMVAVWDGRPETGRGGTADIVAYAVQRQVPLFVIDPSTRSTRRIGANPSK